MTIWESLKWWFGQGPPEQPKCPATRADSGHHKLGADIEEFIRLYKLLYRKMDEDPVQLFGLDKWARLRGLREGMLSGIPPPLRPRPGIR